MKIRFTYHHQYNTIRVSFPRDDDKGFKKVTLPMSLQFHEYLHRAHANLDDQGQIIDDEGLLFRDVAKIYHKTMSDLAQGRFNLKPYQFFCRTLGLPNWSPNLDRLYNQSLQEEKEEQDSEKEMTDD